MTRGLQKKALQSTKLSNGKYLRSELQSAFLFVTVFLFVTKSKVIFLLIALDCELIKPVFFSIINF